MDGIERSIDVLRKLEQNRLAADGLQTQLKQLEADMVNESELGYNSADGTDPSARMKVLLDKQRMLEKQERALRYHVTHVERVLASLKEQEREVLLEFFNTNRSAGASLVQLQHQQHISRSEIYRVRERALYKFATRMGYIASESSDGGNKR